MPWKFEQHTQVVCARIVRIVIEGGPMTAFVRSVIEGRAWITLITLVTSVVEGGESTPVV
jgi:hypothetical protein